MKLRLDAALLLHGARSRAGLTQRDLARRANTAQSVVARIEARQTQPGTETLGRLLEAAGFELRTELVPAPVLQTHMLEDVGRILALTPEERLREVYNVSRFTLSARRV